MRFVAESLIRASPEVVFDFHLQPGVLVKLTPPWEKVRLIEHADISNIGSRTIVESNLLGPLKMTWISQHTVYDRPRLFEDIQLKGPFRRWRHRHIVKPHANGAVLRDEIDYEPPLGILGRLFAPLLVQRRLRRLFDFRHEVTRQDCERKDQG